MEFNKNWWDQYRRDEIENILSLTAQKNSDYTGGETNPNPFENFDQSELYGVDPIIGVNIRLGDKIQRAKAYCKDGKLSLNVKGDSVKDIYRDIIGYCLIILGMLERKKDMDKSDTI